MENLQNKSIYQTFKREKGVSAFLIVLLLQSLSFGFYKGVQDNYLAQIAHINAFQRGLLEFFRELPGVLLIFILALLYKVSETKILKVGMAIGLATVLGLAFSSGAILPTFILITLYSLGDHIVLPVKSTIAMDHARENKDGVALGFMNSIVNLGNVIGLLVVSLIFFIFRRRGLENSIFSFRLVFLISFSLMLMALLFSSGMKDEKVGEVKRERLYFRKKYTKFYMLEVFYGARKQVFFTFAPYVIILQYGADTSIISLLLAVAALCSIFISPLIGKIIDKLGYKVVMVADTLILIVVCFFYGFSHRIFPKEVAFYVVCVNYILDAVISLASMATNVYARDLSSSHEELTATLTTGISVNHFISIFIALFGGMIWTKTGIEVLFSISAFLGLCNSLFALTIPSNKKKRAKILN